MSISLVSAISAAASSISAQKKYLVQGAVLECEHGAETFLLVPNSHGTLLSDRPVATKTDHVVGENVYDFVACTSSKNELKPVCMAEIDDPWQNTITSLGFQGEQVMSVDCSYLVCTRGNGIIEPLTTGQGDLSDEDRMKIIWMVMYGFDTYTVELVWKIYLTCQDFYYSDYMFCRIMALNNYNDLNWKLTAGSLNFSGARAAMMAMGLTAEESDWLCFAIQSNYHILSEPKTAVSLDSETYEEYLKAYISRYGTDAGFEKYWGSTLERMQDRNDFAHQHATMASALYNDTNPDHIGLAEIYCQLAYGATAEEMSGWLGDLLLGDGNMDNDDYKSDLDAANIVNDMRNNGTGYAEAMDDYYNTQSGADNRADIFKEHTSLDHIAYRLTDTGAPMGAEFFTSIAKGSSDLITNS